MAHINADLTTAIAFGLFLALLGLIGNWQAARYATARLGKRAGISCVTGI